MSPAAKSHDAHLGHLIVESLERVSLSEIRRTVLRQALDDAELETVPDQLEALMFFVSGPLYERAQKALGDAFAEAMLVEMNPVLDHAWELARADLNFSGSSRPGQGVAPPDHDTPTSAIRAGTRMRSAIRRCGDEGSPSSAVDAVRDTDPVRDTDVVPPLSKRNTVPYLESVLKSEACCVLVAHADDTRRCDIARAFANAGHSVVTAHDTRVATLLLGRVKPSIVVAEVETIAPDFEPLGPVLEHLFGDCRAVPVVLLSDHQRPDLPDVVKAIVSEASTPEEVLKVVESVRQA